jgi:phospholipid/cholesterol/gamma-HCH transport system substrate-binding protein
MSNEFKIGLMAIIVIALAVWGYTFLRGRNMLKVANEYYVRYENIDQLAVTSPVLIRGLQVGTVSNVRLDDDMQSIVVKLDIDKGIRIPKDAVALVVNVSIMGGKAVELRVSGACEGDECAEPGSFIEGRVKGIFDSFLDKGEDGTLAQVKTQISDILKTLGDSLTSPNSDNEIAKTYTNLSNLIENLSSITNTLDNSMGKYDRHIGASLANVEAITGAFARNQDKIAMSIQNLESLTRQLEQAQLGQTTKNINDLVVDAQVTVNELNQAVGEAQTSFTKLSAIMKDMQDGKGSLGKLLKDEKLYNHALATTRNLELLLQDFRLNPKRYVSVSVFGKKQKEYTVPSEDPAFLPDTNQ